MLPSPRTVRRVLALSLGLGIGVALVVVALKLRSHRGGGESVRFEHFDLVPSGISTAPVLAAEEPDEVSALDASAPCFPPSTFRRRPLSVDELDRLQPEGDQRTAPDPNAYVVYRPYIDSEHEWPEHHDGRWRRRTNALGLRDDAEVLATHPDLRVLVAGDSHTDGVCNNAETFAEVLEARLEERDSARTFEVLNAGHGGYSFHNYLGTLERYLWLEPDIFVVAVYGGNDFEEVLSLHHLFAGTDRPPGLQAYGELFDRARKRSLPALAQAFVSLKYFQRNPRQVDVALQAARDIATEIQVTCARFGVHPVFVYVPPFVDAQPARCTVFVPRVLESLELEESDLTLHDRMADSFLEFLRQRRIDVVDLRPAFRAADEPLYWQSDHHINVNAHRRVADALLPVVQGVLSTDRQRIRAGLTRELDRDERRALLSPGAPGTAEFADFYEWIGGDPADPPASILIKDPRPFAPVVAPVLRIDSPRTESGAHACRVAILGDGRCDTAGEPLAKLVEASLARLDSARAIEVTSASASGAGFDSYVAGLERILALEPEVVVLVVNGDDDWAQVLDIRRKAQNVRPHGAHPYLEAAARYAEADHESARALRLSVEATLELERRCADDGAALVVVHVPACFETPGSGALDRHAAEIATLGLDAKHMANAARLSRRYLGDLRGHGLAPFDLAPILARLPRGGLDPTGTALDRDTRALAGELLGRRIAAALSTVQGAGDSSGGAPAPGTTPGGG